VRKTHVRVTRTLCIPRLEIHGRFSGKPGKKKRKNSLKDIKKIPMKKWNENIAKKTYGECCRRSRRAAATRRHAQHRRELPELGANQFCRPAARRTGRDQSSHLHRQVTSDRQAIRSGAAVSRQRCPTVKSITVDTDVANCAAKCSRWRAISRLSTTHVANGSLFDNG
jgi:hypothetical protein